MVGETISHYRIVGQVGAGGMGVVYAAEDSRLGRRVALKFLPEDLAKDTQAVERLKSEARTASSLSHASICTIYDIGEHDGRPFIVMELLEGQTLRDRLAGGPLKVHEIVNIGIQVADALDSAHRRNIIHRDIKPPNLFLLERGQVKILDFGLAKLLSRHAAVETTTVSLTADLTRVGETLGTVAYMSPEQVTGEQLDGRTDLFSLGVVLYECVTGRQPFQGKTSAVIFSAILTRAPVAPIVLNPDMPLRLQEVINNCLEKDRELRYQDAAGLRADLLRLKRDLESGHSGVVRIPGALNQENDTIPSSGRGASGPRGVLTAESAASVGVTTRRPRASGLSVRAVAAVAAFAVLIAGGAAYLLWPRPPGSPNTGSALAQNPLDLATASLQVRNYRAALAYAEEALRATPGQAEAVRVQNEARGKIAAMDGAVAKARGLLAAGDTAGAASALDEARAIDPAAPAIADLSAFLVNALRNQADTTRSGQAPPQGPAPLSRRQAANESSQSTVQQRSSNDGSRPAALPSAPTPASSAVAPAPPLVTTPAPAPPPATVASNVPPSAPSVPESSATANRPPVASSDGSIARVDQGAAAPPAEDDDAAIRRVIATYARAIETKDMALFRSVKPNLSAEEQRRIDEGFRAVTSQEVNVTILAIERRGQDASVRLRRRDTIRAGGRQQTTESQQAMTLTRTSGGWIIREIGR